MARITIGRKLHKDTDSVTVAQGPPNGAPWPVRDEAKLVPEIFDYIEILSKNANGDPTSVVYRTGGSGGIPVATLTITYDGDGDVQSVARS